MAPTGPAYFTDWIYANNSNVHVATDKGWFKPGTFKPIDSHVGHAFLPGQKMKVLGIGDVEFYVKMSKRDKTGKKCLVKDVLYAPDGIANILGNRLLVKNNVDNSSVGPNRCDIKNKETGQLVGILDCTKFTKLWLVRHAWGRSSLDERKCCIINAHWSDDERAKVATQLRGQSSFITEYTAAEKAWIKKNYKNEFDFLRCHGLSIYKDEVREEGRSIVRAFMSED